MSGKFETEPYYNKSISGARQEIVKLAYIQTTKIPVRIITYGITQYNNLPMQYIRLTLSSVIIAASFCFCNEHHFPLNQSTVHIGGEQI